MKHRNYYRCSCGETWEEISEPGTMDRCPCCDKETVPFRSLRIGEKIETLKKYAVQERENKD